MVSVSLCLSLSPSLSMWQAMSQHRDDWTQLNCVKVGDSAMKIGGRAPGKFGWRRAPRCANQSCYQSLVKIHIETKIRNPSLLPSLANLPTIPNYLLQREDIGAQFAKFAIAFPYFIISTSGSSQFAFFYFLSCDFSYVNCWVILDWFNLKPLEALCSFSSAKHTS